MGNNYFVSKILGSARRFALFVVLILLFFLLGIGLAYFLAGRSDKPEILPAQPSISTVDEGQIGGGLDQKLTVNAQLQVNGQFFLAPSSVPQDAKAGTLVFDQATSTLQYYNGTEFVPLTAQQAVPEGGVTALQGQTGAITLTPGAGIAINGTTISNSGILGINGVPGDINVTTANGIASLSLPQSIAPTASPTFDGLSLANALGVAYGGTGAANFTTNGVLIGNGTGAFGTVTAVAPGQCLISTAGAPQFGACAGGGSGVSTLNGLTGNLSIANASGVGTTVTIDDASTSAKGIAQFNASNFSVASGVVNTIQNIGTAATPTFGGLTLSSPLNVSSGGTGRNSLTANGLLYGNGTGAVQSLAVGTTGQCLIATTGAAPVWGSCDPGGSGIASLNLAGTSGTPQSLTDGDTITIAAGSNITTTAGATDTLTVAVVSNPSFNSLTLSTALGLASGGTGATTAQGAINAISGLTTNGDLLYHNGTNATRLARGTNGQCLLSTGTTIQWSTCTGAGGVSSVNGFSGVVTVQGTANQVIVNNSLGTITLSTPQDINTSSSPTFAGLTLSAPLAVSSGGTGTATLTAGGVLFGNGTGAITASAVLTNGQLLIGDGTGAPTAAALTQGSGIQITNGAGSITIGVDSTVCTTSGNCAGVGGTGDIVNGGQGGPVIVGTNNLTSTVLETNNIARLTIDSVGTATFSGALIVQGIAYFDGNIELEVGDTFTVNGDALTDLTGDGLQVVTGALGVDSTVCRTSGNCVGGGSGGAPNSAAYLTVGNDATLGSERAIAAGTNLSASDGGINSTYTLSVVNNPTFSGLLTAQAGISVTAGQTFTFNGDAFTDLTGTGLMISGGALQSTLGTSVDLASEITGTLPVGNGGTGATTFTANGVLFGNGTGAVQATAAGTTGQCLLATTGSAPAWGTCTGAGGVASLNGQTGSVIIANATGLGGTVTIDDASTIAKGIASFNSTNFSVTGGAVNTVQDIATTSSPTFAGLTLSSALTVANGGTGATTFTANGILFGNAAGAVQATAAGTTGQCLLATTGSAPSWGTCTGDGVGVTTVGAIDSQTASANGAVITGSSIYLQSASATVPGLVNTTAQTFAGNKTFSGSVLTSTVDTASATTLNLGTTTATAVTIGRTAGTVNVAGGNINLQGNTAVASGMSLTVTSGELAVTGRAAGSNTTFRVNNHTSTGSIFVAQDAATDVFTIANGGNVTMTGTLSVTSGAIQVGNDTGNAYVMLDPSATGTSTIDFDGLLGTNHFQFDNNTDTFILKRAGLDQLTVSSTGMNLIYGDLSVGSADTTAQLLVLDTKTDAGDPAGQTGGMYYNSNANKFRCYENGAWVDCITSPGGLFTDSGAYAYLTQTTDNITLGGSVNGGSKLEVVGDINSRGLSWTSRTSAADNLWSSITYGNGLFVAVAYSGTGNRVMTSPDGVNWTARTSAADNSWSGVTYGNGLFVAVSFDTTSNRVMTSPDGITWTLRASAADKQWRDVVYGNGLFVAVANNSAGNGDVMTSPDGVNWTLRSSSVSRNWSSITYGNGLFVAVANSGTGNRVMTSPDGVNWTARTSAADNSWLSITYGNGLFVAVGASGTGNRVMTSPDGITWTTRTSAADLSWGSVAYGDGLFVAIANSLGTSSVMTSPDGITWTTRTSATSAFWDAVTYGNGMFVAVSGSGTGNRVMTSGKTITNQLTETNLRVYGNSLFTNSTNSATAFQIQNASNVALVNVSTNLVKQNLIYNSKLDSSFEGGSSNWKVRHNATATIASAQANFGQYSLELAGGTTLNNGISYYYPLKANTQYTMSMYLKTSSGSSSPWTLGFAATPYSTGTVGTGGVSTTTLTGTGTTWTAAMVGSIIRFADGQERTITARSSNTSITLSSAITLPNLTLYEIETITDCGGAAPVLTTSWTQVTCTFTTGSTIGNFPHIYLRHNITTASTIYMDGVTLVTGGTGLAYVSQGSQLEVEPSAGGTIRLLGESSGELSEWQEGSVLPSPRATPGVTYFNGYAYAIGGSINGTSYQSTSYYARVHTDGSLGNWAATTALPSGKGLGSAVAVNGYMYYIEGEPGATGVYSAKINTDGTLGNWTLLSEDLPDASNWGASALYANGYLYAVGVGNGNTHVYYAQVQAGGSTGLWQETSALTYGRSDGSTGSVVANGYIYIVGSASGDNKTEYARINSDGTLGAWTTSPHNLPQALAEDPAVAVMNGYLYVIGGLNGGTAVNNVQYAKIFSDGSIDAWKSSSMTLPRATGEAGRFVANGYIYVVGGSTATDAGAAVANVYYASGARVQVGGTLDLVGLQGTNISDANTYYQGGSGGSLIANDGTFVGDVEIAGSLLVGGSFSIDAFSAGSISANEGIRVSSTGSSALTVLSPDGTNLIAVDTRDSAGVNIVNEASASFEDGSIGLWGALGTGVVSGTEADARFGARSLQIVTGTAANNGAAYPYKFWSDTPYGISVWLKRSTASTNTINIGYHAGGSDVDCLTGQTVTTTWTKYSCTFTTGSWPLENDNYVYIKQTDTTTDTIYLDGFSIAGGSAADYVEPASILQVSAVNQAVNIFTSGLPEPGPWQVANNPNDRMGHGTVYVNGYIYILGGQNSSFAEQDDVFYAKVNANGSLGTWNSTTSLPYNMSFQITVSVNGYIYILDDSTVYFSRINRDGTLGSWTATTGPTNSARPGIAVNGMIYVFNGDTIYTARPNLDGTISSWSTSASVLPAALWDGGLNYANGYLYYSGGYDGATGTTATYYARVNTDGTLGSWATSTNLLPSDLYCGTTAVANGYLYWFMGGNNDCNTLSNTHNYYAKLNSDGSIGQWHDITNVLPEIMRWSSSVVINGYVYILGGEEKGGAGVNNHVYYARMGGVVSVNGSIDLVGGQGGNLNDAGGTSTGGVGGSLTAGNGIFVGSLQVQGAATMNDSLNVQGNFVAGGAALFKNSVDSTSGFAIQDSSSNNLFVVDTTNGRVHVGNPTADSTGTILVLDTKNTSGDPTGVNGGMYYNSNLGKFRCYQDSAWQDCVNNRVVLASDVVNSNASACTVADVTGLNFAVSSGVRYHFRFVIYYTSAATTTGSLWSLNGTGTPATNGIIYTSSYTSTTNATTLNNAATFGFPSGCNPSSATTTGNIAIIEGYYTGTAGTITARFASEVSNSAITAKAGSYVEFWRE